MQIKKLGTNMMTVTTPSAMLLYSYETPVAAFVIGRGYVRTSTKFSTTTTKHINKWLKGLTSDVVEQSYISQLANEGGNTCSASTFDMPYFRGGVRYQCKNTAFANEGGAA